MSFVRLAAKRARVTPLIIFKVAIDYYEVRMSPEEFVAMAKDCIINDIYPIIVEDIAMMVLTGQVSFTDKGGQDDRPGEKNIQ